MRRLLEVCMEEMSLEVVEDGDKLAQSSTVTCLVTKKGKHIRCEHFREKRYCKECKGCKICEHDKIRNKCRVCSMVKLSSGKMVVSGSFCDHGKRKGYCKDCSPGQLCEHGRQRYTCKECKGTQICEHQIQKAYCKQCKGNQLCEHLKNRRICKMCKAMNPGITAMPLPKKKLTDLPSLVLDSGSPAMRIDNLVLNSVRRCLFQ